MISRKLTLQNKLGLHARPASRIVKLATRYKGTTVELVRGGDIVNGKSILGVMMLAAGMGTELEIRVDGPQEADLLEEIAELINNKFYEE
ncbi:HPr family phosphocarrier protein [bacterium]|nr:HPr family phosphocarrier protein [bacterium]